tara:strand:- start:1088 stop:1999 length:912 start_codon:yes stop_codon:yes gene_type:complete
MNIPGEIFALMAALFWSIAVVIFRSLSKSISPFLINALKNTIALICFIILLLILKIPFWNNSFTNAEYMKFIISGFLGMGVADAVFIYALSKIGANRIAILNCFEPVVIYFLTLFFLSGNWLTGIETLGFIIVIISILIISYERDESDIPPRIKQQGLILQICAILFSSISMVMIKNILNNYQTEPDVILWIAVFRLFIGFLISWTIFLFLKDSKKLLKALKGQIVITKVISSSILGTFMALTCWIMGQAYIKKLALASIIGQTSLIFIMFFSWLFLREKITKTRIIASVFALIGVFLSNYFK